MKGPEQPKDKDEYTPFKNKEEFSEGRSEKFEHSSEGAGMISREELVEFLANDLGTDPEDYSGTAKALKSLFEELKNKYSIPIDVKVVVAKTKFDDRQIHFLTHKIEGETIPEESGEEFIGQMTPEERANFTEEMDRLMSGLSRYALENYGNSSFLWDIAGMAQYMWGKKTLEDGSLEKDKHLYLVDIEPHMLGKIGSLKRAMHHEKYFFNDLVGSLETYENLLKFRFVKARENIKKLSDESESARNTWRITELAD